MAFQQIGTQAAPIVAQPAPACGHCTIVASGIKVPFSLLAIQAKRATRSLSIPPLPDGLRSQASRHMARHPTCARQPTPEAYFAWSR
eukprot:6843019-Pyramimonas_sp.AAC.2